MPKLCKSIQKTGSHIYSLYVRQNISSHIYKVFTNQEAKYEHLKSEVNKQYNNS